MDKHDPTVLPPSPHGDEFAEFVAQYAKPLFVGMTTTLFALIAMGVVLVIVKAFGVI